MRWELFRHNRREAVTFCSEGSTGECLSFTNSPRPCWLHEQSDVHSRSGLQISLILAPLFFSPKEMLPKERELVLFTWLWRKVLHSTTLSGYSWRWGFFLGQTEQVNCPSGSVSRGGGHAKPGQEPDMARLKSRGSVYVRTHNICSLTNAQSYTFTLTLTHKPHIPTHSHTYTHTHTHMCMLILEHAHKHTYTLGERGV